MRTPAASRNPRSLRALFGNLTRKERAILGVLAAAVLCGAAGGTAEIVRLRRRAARPPVDLYRQLEAALPDPDFSVPPPDADPVGPGLSGGSVTRPPFSGEPELEVSEDGWFFFPRDYYTTININTAGFDELVTLPGIGPVIAGRIILYRRRFVGFSRIKTLLKVRGIGEKTLQRLEGKIRLY